MTRREELLAFLDSIYVPVKLREEVALLKRIIRENDYRGIEKEDENTIHEYTLVIDTVGKGSRETYSDFTICRVDVGAVGAQMADVAIYYKGNSYMATPKRVSRKNIKINVLQD